MTFRVDPYSLELFCLVAREGSFARAEEISRSLDAIASDMVVSPAVTAGTIVRIHPFLNKRVLCRQGCVPRLNSDQN